MPELPEVETIVRDLKKVLPGLKIWDIWCDHKKMIKNPRSFSGFKKQVVDGKILDVKRKGKNILISLSGGKTLLIHQKMTGHLLYGAWKLESRIWKGKNRGPIRDDSRNGFIHLIFELSNRKQLALSDMRKFAKVLVCETGKLNELKDIKDIGIDPTDKTFTFKKFKEILTVVPSSLKPRKGKIKEVLMKQELVSGIGNIYANEILWSAGVYPFKGVGSLSEKELVKIYKSILKILKKSIKLRGDSMVDYRDAFGEKGKYQNYHKAYKRENEKCSKDDGGIIKRVKKGSRSTFYCPVHQK